MKILILFFLKPFRGTPWCERLIRRRWPKPRATVVHVGILLRDGPNIVVEGWHFDCRGTVPCIEVVRLGDRYETFLCGYTKAELIEIHARKAEWPDT